MKTGRHHTPIGRANMLVLLLGLLLSWQSLVVGTHHHDNFVGQVAASAGARDIDAPGKQPPSQDLPGECSICREIAHAGAALLPPTVAIEPPVFTAFWAAPPAPLGAAPAPRSHRWRSRAPPAALPA